MYQIPTLTVVNGGFVDMQMIVYAVRTPDAWRCYLSLDMQVDLHWWYGDREGQKGISSPRMVILASSIPLGWAASIRDTFRPLQEMDQWGVGEWQGYVDKQIVSFISEEPERNQARWRTVTQDVRMLDERAVLSGWTPNDSKEWTALRRQAEQLISAIEGRALLAGEVEALLAEAAGVPGGWRSAAQLGVLLGRLRMEAGLAQPAPRVPPGRLRRGRAMAPCCRRCGSEARSRTACAACGSAACAYCEACLAMGRSRACTLLLHGAAGPAVRGPAGGCPTEARG
ncbi:DNA/RNA helicase, partial [Paenibacillus lactis]